MKPWYSYTRRQLGQDSDAILPSSEIEEQTCINAGGKWVPTAYGYRCDMGVAPEANVTKVTLPDGTIVNTAGGGGGGASIVVPVLIVGAVAALFLMKK